MAFQFQNNPAVSAARTTYLTGPTTTSIDPVQQLTTTRTRRGGARRRGRYRGKGKKLPAFPKKAFNTHIKNARKLLLASDKCRVGAKRKGKAPSRSCLKKRGKAQAHLQRAALIFHLHRTKQRQKGKWTSKEDRYFSNHLSRASALLRARSLSLAPKGKTKRGAAIQRSISSGRAIYATTQATPAASVEAYEVIEDLPTDEISGETAVTSYEFSPSDEEDALAVYEDEIDTGDEGVMAKLTANPLLTAVGVAVIGGVIYVAYQRLT